MSRHLSLRPSSSRDCSWLAPFLAIGLLAAVAACGPGRAVDDLRGEVLFYGWAYGSTLSDDPANVAEITGEKVWSLRQIDAFEGTLEEWVQRTEPVQRIRIGPEDFVVDSNIFFYYLASLRRPALTDRLQIRIIRTAPDGSSSLDLQIVEDARMNKMAQSGGLLLSVGDLPAGDHLLRLEVLALNGNRVDAAGDLWIEFHPGAVEEALPGGSL